jgi:hypothetical protein
MKRVLAVALVAAAVCGCGRSGDRQAVRDAALRFYSAVEHHEGAGACSLLSADTRKALEQQESASCDRAVERLDLTNGTVATVSVYSTEAKVELRGGDTVFLQDTKEGWRIAAAGCRPNAHEKPADCEVEA